MTLKYNVECDALDCNHSCEIEGDSDSDVNREGYHVDPDDRWTHYCNKCWPEVKKEIEDRDNG